LSGRDASWEKVTMDVSLPHGEMLPYDLPKLTDFSVDSGP
jgi:hypothetical protein